MVAWQWVSPLMVWDSLGGFYMSFNSTSRSSVSCICIRRWSLCMLVELRDGEDKKHSSCSKLSRIKLELY